MSAVNVSPLDMSRPPSQQRDQLILQVELVPLAGKLLTIEIFEMQPPPSSKPTPTSLVRPSSQSSVAIPPLSTSRTAGFRVAARDEVEHEYSLFVTRQKAEYLYRAAYPTEAAASEVITPEAMANGILTHLNIIGNRQRDVGKLTCREPEPRFEKKTRVSPTNISQQKNPHLTFKRQDQRAVRVQKTSIRAMEAASKARHRSDSQSIDFNYARGSIQLESVPRIDRKTSEASILHRMASTDSQTVWSSGLPTNYEESEHVQEDNDDPQRRRQVTISTLSPVKRALPERKMKHKGLEERRQKGRQQRILAAQAAQDASLSLLNSFHSHDFYNDVIEESELESRDPSRRSSMVTTVATEKPIPQSRAASAPRSSVGNAYALKNLAEPEVEEPEQFLRRRTLDTSSRSVFKTDGWNDDVFGMGIEITDERPGDHTPSNRLDMSNGARRVMLVNALGSPLQRIFSTSNVTDERSNAPASSTAHHSGTLGASSSAPALQSPVEGPVVSTNSVSPAQSIVKADENEKNSPRPRSKSRNDEQLSTENNTVSNVAALPVEKGIGIQVSDHHPSTAGLIEITAEPAPRFDSPSTEIRPRSRSNSVGMEGIVRLAPLTSIAKPPVQEFLAPPEPEESINSDPTPGNDEKETQVPLPDPEIVLYTPSKLVAEAEGDPTVKTHEDSADQDQTILHQEFIDGIEAPRNMPLPVIDTVTAAHETIAPLEALLPATQKSFTTPLTTRQPCWEEQVPPIALVVPEVNCVVPGATISPTASPRSENDRGDTIRESVKEENPSVLLHAATANSDEIQDPGVTPVMQNPGEQEGVSKDQQSTESNANKQPQELVIKKSSADPLGASYKIENQGAIKNDINILDNSMNSTKSEQLHLQTNEMPQQSITSEKDHPDKVVLDSSTESQSTANGGDQSDRAGMMQLGSSGILMDSNLSNQLAATVVENYVIPEAVTFHDIPSISRSDFINSNDDPPLNDNIIDQAQENATCQTIENAPLSPDDNDHALTLEDRNEGGITTSTGDDNIGRNGNIDTATNEDEKMIHGGSSNLISNSPSKIMLVLEHNESSNIQDSTEESVNLPQIKLSPHAHGPRTMDGSRGHSEKKAPSGEELVDIKVVRLKKSTSKERDGVPSEHIEGKVQNEPFKSTSSSYSPSTNGTKKKLAKEKLDVVEPQISTQHKRKDCSPRAEKVSSPTVAIPVQFEQTPIELSPKNEKLVGISRKRSQNSSSNVLLPSSTEQVKSSIKGSGSRKKSIVQPTEAQTISPPNLEPKQQLVEDVKNSSLLRSMRRVGSVEKCDALLGSASAAKAQGEKLPGEAQPAQSKHQLPAKRQSSRLVGASQNASNYHKKWGKWLAGRNIIEKASCLQLEERVMQDPRDGENLLKLGLRYAQWHGTSLPGILLLEHASLLHKNTIGSHEYWFWLGSAHLDMFMRHRKYLPIARFHLSKCIRAFTSAFAYIEAFVDPMLLLRYAIGLFWHKGDGNLEKTCDVFHELFSRFVIFCDKDRPNLLFLQFQVLHRLKLYVDAIECMNKIVDIHQSPQHPTVSTGNSILSTDAMAHFNVYDTTDYLLMLMQCQQASGDSVSAAQTLTSVLKFKGALQDNTLKDDEYFELWCSLAEKCFHHEDYALAMEYYALALNFAKQSQELATIHYNLGLCFQALGEDSKCVTEYKRARTSNRHVTPLVSLAELTASYEEQFALLLQKSVAQTVEEVRVDLYGIAVKRLQRIFRRNRRDPHNNTNDINADSSVTKMPTLSRRRTTVRNPPALVKIEDAAEGAEAEVAFQQQVEGINDNQVSKCDDSTLEVIERRHESFLARKQAAMDEMAELLTNPQYRYQPASQAPSPSVRPKVGVQIRSGMLSPEKDRLDMRRNQSLEAFRQLGYVSSTMPWIEFWEKLLPLASELFESRQALYGSIARIRGRLPLVTDEIAFCALAECIGNVHQAAEKLHDSLYERELAYVCAVIDVSKQLVRDFPSEPTQAAKPVHVLLPTIALPTAEAHSPVGAMSPNRVLLPPYSPVRGASVSPSKVQNPTKHLRMNQMLNMHFQEHVQQQEAAIAITKATGGAGKPRQRTEKLMVLQGFRQANSSLLSSQLAFGSEKAAT